MRSTRSRTGARGAQGSEGVFGIAGFALAALVLVPASSPAQTLQTGILTGRVSDNTGARAPGATVTLSSPVLLTPRTSITDGEGAYRFAALPPGTYSLSLELQGFRKLTRTNVLVDAGVTRTVDVTLEVGAMEETVEVVGGHVVGGRDPDERRHHPRHERPAADPHRARRVGHPAEHGTPGGARPRGRGRQRGRPAGRLLEPRQHLAPEHLRAQRGQRHRPRGHGRGRLLLRLRQLRAGADLHRAARGRGGHARRLLQLRGQAGHRLLPRRRRLLLREQRPRERQRRPVPERPGHHDGSRHRPLLRRHLPARRPADQGQAALLHELARLAHPPQGAELPDLRGHRSLLGPAEPQLSAEPEEPDRRPRNLQTYWKPNRNASAQVQPDSTWIEDDVFRIFQAHYNSQIKTQRAARRPHQLLERGLPAQVPGRSHPAELDGADHRQPDRRGPPRLSSSTARAWRATSRCPTTRASGWAPTTTSARATSSAARSRSPTPRCGTASP